MIESDSMGNRTLLNTPEPLQLAIIYQNVFSMSRIPRGATLIRGFHLRSGLHDRRWSRFDQRGEIKGVNSALNLVESVDAGDS